MSSMERSRSREGSRSDRARAGQGETRSMSRSPSRDSRNPGNARGRSGSRERSDRGRSSPNHSRSRSASRHRSRTRSLSRSLSRDSNLPRSAKIVIERLTKNIHRGHIREVFGLYGEILEIEFPENPQFMMNRGAAYILYADTAFAERAIANMHEAQFDGARISVSIVLPRRRFSRSPPQMQAPPQRFGEPHRHYGTSQNQRQSTFRGQGRGNMARRPSPGYRQGHRRSPPPGRYDRAPGYRDRYDDRDPYHRPRSYSRSISPQGRRGRNPRYGSRSRSPSHTPPARRGDRSPPRGGGRRGRSPSYSEYSARSRSYSRERGNRGRGRR